MIGMHDVVLDLILIYIASSSIMERKKNQHIGVFGEVIEIHA